MTTRWLQRGLLIALVAACLYFSIANLVSTRGLGSTSEDPVAAWDARFVPVKARLPFERGVVGYISDSAIPNVNFDAANEEGEYVLTQYALAPIIIVKGTDQEWNIANLSRAGFEQWNKAHRGRFEVTTFKGGLYLLHRVGN